LLSEEASENFWPSFADLTSTITLILFVLVLLAYIQNLISEKRVSHARSQLAQAVERLDAARGEVEKSQSRLRALGREISVAQAQLQLSQEKIGQQTEAISASNRELDELRARLQGIAILRLDVLQKVKASIESELKIEAQGAAPMVSIAENGNIVINESLVFESNSHRIKKQGEPFLGVLANGLANVLADPNVRTNIDAVVVQGHTDERGSVEYNRELSSKRANAVLNYMFEANPSLGSSYGSYFASSAFSEFRPLDPQKTEAAFQQNRRIEISVVLKDTSVREVIEEYMRNLDPVFQQPTPTDAP
jgi:chemotaxis protein MotB